MPYNGKILLPNEDLTKNALNIDDSYNEPDVIDTVNPPSPIQVVDPWTMKVNTDIDSDKFNFDVKKGTIQAPLPDIGNLGQILQDILAGDPDAIKRPEYTCLNLDAVKKALDWLANTNQLSDTAKANMLTESWRLNFRDKPPTAEEFLTSKYLGPMAENIYPHIKKAFIESMDPLKPYRTTILYSCIGSGKSLMTVLTNLYITVLFALMWHPYRYFGQSVSTQYCNVLCATSMKKGSELLLEPMLNIIENASYFQKCRTKYDMQQEEREFDGSTSIDHINWTTATPSSFLATSNGLNYKLISSANGLLGQAQPLDEKIKLPDDTYTTMGKLKVGSKIKNPAGGEETVLATFPQGKIACYRITLSDGRSTRCSANHQWKVAWEKDKNNHYIWKVVSTQFMIDHPEYDFEIFDDYYNTTKDKV
jgi:hypothetical protein